MAPNVALDSTALEDGKFSIARSSFPKCDRTYTETIVVGGEVFETVVCESDGGGSGGGDDSGGGSGDDDLYSGGDFGGGGAGGSWPSDSDDSGGGGGGSGGDSGSGTGGENPCSQCVPVAPPEDIGTAVLGSDEEVQNASNKIADHAYQKHVVDRGEYPNINSKEEFRSMIEGIIRNPDAVDFDLANTHPGYAFWSDDHGVRGTIVIYRPSSSIGGTAFSPRNGRDYFDNDWK